MQKHTKITTGFSFLDQNWGGVYAGGNYLIFGPKKSGKTVLALNIIDYLSQSNYNTLLFTSERKKSLEIQAASIYFDIDEQINKGILNVLKISNEYSNFEEIKKSITEKNPSIIIIDEIIDNNLSFLGEVYIDFLEFLENMNITTFFVSSIPINDQIKLYLKRVVKNSTGIIHLRRSVSSRNYSGLLTIKPNVGHFEGEFETSYKVEPVKGVITVSDNENAILDLLAKSESSEIIKGKEDFEYSNVYSLDEFKFLVESRTALSERTGEKINIIIYELFNDFTQPIELLSKFRKKLEKGDKISFSDDKIFILPGNNDTIYVNKLSNDLDEVTSKIFGLKNSFKNIKKSVQVLKPNFTID